MKIIQNNYENKLDNIEYICEECNSVFQYNDCDISIDADGVESVTCPCCNHRCIVNTPTTEDNIEFPKSFYQFGINDGAVKIDDDKITSEIKSSIKWLKDHPDADYRYWATGDTFSCVFNHKDEYYIMVAKNYFDSYIDK